MRPFMLASASMKWFTVDPVPTPTTWPALDVLERGAPDHGFGVRPWSFATISV